MAQRVFTKDTMLDLVVNLIPMGIMAFFIGLFVLWGPFDWDPLYSTLMLGIIGGSFVLLAILTYVSAIAIEGDSDEGDANEGETAEAAAGEHAEMEDDETATRDADSSGGLDHELDTAPAESDGDADDPESDDDDTVF